MALNRPRPPLPLPSNAVYTSCYCEENIYLLAQTFAGAVNAAGRASPGPWEIYVVFVSNGGKTVRNSFRSSYSFSFSFCGHQPNQHAGCP